MKSKEQQLLKIKHLSDQSWAGMAAQADEIQRVAESGPRFGDELLVRMVFNAVCGELHMRAYDATDVGDRT